LAPYAPALEVVGKGGADGAVAWVASRLAGDAVRGTLTVPGLAAGEYRVTWWDTGTGQPSGEATVSAGAAGLKLETPAIAGDAAVTLAPL
ncbi:MAG: hypothetical protein HYU66_04065, partial [Armatimonadetes bacterium]|nr:hypothetical protein [Armatimonadota bacterium]